LKSPYIGPHLSLHVELFFANGKCWLVFTMFTIFFHLLVTILKWSLGSTTSNHMMNSSHLASINARVSWYSQFGWWNFLVFISQKEFDVGSRIVVIFPLVSLLLLPLYVPLPFLIVCVSCYSFCSLWRYLIHYTFHTPWNWI
jgi:hypothetical protein